MFKFFTKQFFLILIWKNLRDENPGICGIEGCEICGNPGICWFSKMLGICGWENCGKLGFGNKFGIWGWEPEFWNKLGICGWEDCCELIPGNENWGLFDPGICGLNALGPEPEPEAETEPPILPPELLLLSLNPNPKLPSLLVLGNWKPNVFPAETERRVLPPEL